MVHKDAADRQDGYSTSDGAGNDDRGQQNCHGKGNTIPHLVLRIFRDRLSIPGDERLGVTKYHPYWWEGAGRADLTAMTFLLTRKRSQISREIFLATSYFPAATLHGSTVNKSCMMRDSLPTSDFQGAISTSRQPRAITINIDRSVCSIPDSKEYKTRRIFGATTGMVIDNKESDVIGKTWLG
ncbi:hypothetical protein Bbelb_089750 [Branchiostoma belcheri]|nr:hypothetical protein Bbelb_089750 [Branchiostoma belcheri]